MREKGETGWIRGWGGGERVDKGIGGDERIGKRNKGNT